MPKARFQIERKCNVCGQTFLAKNLDSIHCSRKCSNAAYRMKKRREREEAQLRQKAQAVPNDREYISVAEAIAIFAVSRSTLYRNIRSGKIPVLNMGTRLIRINRSMLEHTFNKRDNRQLKADEVDPNIYDMSPEHCYTIGEISEKYDVSPSTVYSNIRKHSIPIRQIGKFVYASKNEIDKIFKY